MLTVMVIAAVAGGTFAILGNMLACGVASGAAIGFACMAQDFRNTFVGKEGED
jgi:hypothetical protein